MAFVALYAHICNTKNSKNRRNHNRKTVKIVGKRTYKRTYLFTPARENNILQVNHIGRTKKA